MPSTMGAWVQYVLSAQRSPMLPHTCTFDKGVASHAAVAYTCSSVAGDNHSPHLAVFCTLHLPLRPQRVLYVQMQQHIMMMWARRFIYLNQGESFISLEAQRRVIPKSLTMPLLLRYLRTYCIPRQSMCSAGCLF